MFLVIDGSSMLVTAYHALLPNEIKFERDDEKKKLYYDKIMHNSAGEYTNALYGMTSQLLKIINEQKPEYMAIVFDKSRNTFRRTLYKDYKAQRKKTAEPLSEQFIAMEKIIEKLGIKCLYSDTVEADDLAGLIVSRELAREDNGVMAVIAEQRGLTVVGHNLRTAALAVVEVGVLGELVLCLLELLVGGKRLELGIYFLYLLHGEGAVAVFAGEGLDLGVEFQVRAAVRTFIL